MGDAVAVFWRGYVAGLCCCLTLTRNFSTTARQSSRSGDGVSRAKQLCSKLLKFGVVDFLTLAAKRMTKFSKISHWQDIADSHVEV